MGTTESQVRLENEKGTSAHLLSVAKAGSDPARVVTIVRMTTGLSCP